MPVYFYVVASPLALLQAPLKTIARLNSHIGDTGAILAKAILLRLQEFDRVLMISHETNATGGFVYAK